MALQSHELPSSNPREKIENERAYMLRKRFLERAVRRGRVNLLLSGRWIYIMGRRGHPSLTQVVFTDEITVRDISKKTNPWETIIFEKREKDDQSRLIQIAKELPAYFRAYFPGTEETPISLYGSRKSFMEKISPLAVVRLENDLATVDIPTSQKSPVF